MPRKAIHESGTMQGLPLNIRLTKQQHELLERLAAAEKADIAAKLGGYAPPFTRADLIRQWIENAARGRGFLPSVPAPPPVQGVLFPVAVPPPIVSAPPAPEAPEAPAPVQEVDVQPEAPAPIVSAPPAPEAPVKRRRGKVEPDDVRAALEAAIAAGEKQKDIGAAAGVDPSTMSKFLKNTREIPKDKFPALVKHLRKLGYLKQHDA